MDIIKCVVRGQRLSVNVPVMADLTVRYFNLTANFDSTWDKYTQRWVHIHKKDELTNGSDWVLDHNNEVAADAMIHLENGEWEIWFHGIEFYPNSTTMKSRITTEIKYFKVLATGTDGGLIPDIPESNVEQITAIAQEALDIATELELRADSGEFQGEQGPVGPQGPQGVPGETGPTGPQGETGPTGPAGADGPQGPQGIQGPEGPIGKSFTVIDTLASTADLPANPQEGDAYGVGTEPPYHVYMYGATSGWVDYGSIIQGPPGPQGAQGPQGLQGIQGETGPQGIQGIQGIQGEPGPTGATGAQGEAGPQGETGPAGPAGPKGDTGATGPAGPAGEDAPDDYVLVQSNQPTSETNKLWIDSDQIPPVMVLTPDELPVVFNVTLLSSGWSNNEQTVSDNRLLVGNYVYTVGPDPSDIDGYGTAKVYAYNVTVAGSMTFHCTTAPSGNLSVIVKREVIHE